MLPYHRHLISQVHDSQYFLVKARRFHCPLARRDNWEMVNYTEDHLKTFSSHEKLLIETQTHK